MKNLNIVFMTGGAFDYLRPETNTRRYFILEESKLNSNSPCAAPAPNALQLLIDDDALASSCQTLAQYRRAVALLLQNQFAGAPAAVGQAHTPGRITAPIAASGRAFGLIPEGKGWANDLINWSTREFRNPADARRIHACWNAFDGVRTEDIEARNGWKIVGEEGSTIYSPTLEAFEFDLMLSQAASDVLAERRRQVDHKGWDHAHDDAHPNDEIAAFAAVYAMPEAARDWPATGTGYGDTFAKALCPVDWSPIFGDRRRDLVKAGALILAEIERLDRASNNANGGAA